MIQLSDEAKPKLERLKQILDDISSRTATVGYDGGDSGVYNLASEGIAILKEVIPTKINVQDGK